MASADGDGQEGCANQLTLADCPNVAASAEDIAMGGVDCLLPNKDQEEAAGSQPEVAFIIGTPNDFHEGKAHKYYKGRIKKQTIYYSDKGSEWSRDVNEVLVLLRENKGWIAYDADVSFNWKKLHCRQPVFRCYMTDITQQGKYMWQTNRNASYYSMGFKQDWQDGPEAETRWP